MQFFIKKTLLPANSRRVQWRTVLYSMPRFTCILSRLDNQSKFQPLTHIEQEQGDHSHNISTIDWPAGTYQLRYVIDHKMRSELFIVK